MVRRLEKLEEDATRLSKKDLADTGTQTSFDANRLTFAGSSYTPISQPYADQAFAKRDRKTADRLRVAKAREHTSSYKAKKAHEKSKEYLSLEEKYRPAPSSLEGLQSLAEERIDEARRNGAFKNLDGKGKRLDLAEAKSTIDRTEYFLNKIIKKQGALPPFVDAQVNVDRSIAAFRYSLQSLWIETCCKLIALSGGTLEAQRRRAEEYAEAERTGRDRLRDANFVKRETPFMIAQVNALNAQIRGYNVIAPFNSRRGYLSLQAELDQCYRNAAPIIPRSLVERANAPKFKDSAAYKAKYTHTPLLDHLFGKQKSQFYERNDGVYGFYDWIRDNFGKGRVHN
ncbi:hypothetical protein BCR37DRAFT_400543 [Protomyces lactucae-debilis]|uniref:DnaJ homologue subfamily C member 28 conserved domain-containing protein n=1 Tax=Protomyces lactucae-debilis TaxID=2754530 RepID=A0A1Y2F1B1_PROLT|nr:uncharacterized protein BCR37DRAFT_400543 [Protomyces lactucae-debilis]ORY77284.1 hypothetical protein BCR37DRAFT_400543 [Protomyces lactucae-debilis]